MKNFYQAIILIAISGVVLYFLVIAAKSNSTINFNSSECKELRCGGFGWGLVFICDTKINDNCINKKY